MDNKFLESIGVDVTVEPGRILEQLEEKQLEYFERLENVSDEARENELKKILQRIEEETVQVKKVVDAISRSLIVDDGSEEGKKEAPGKKDNKIAKEIEGLKKQSGQQSDPGQVQSGKPKQDSSQVQSGKPKQDSNQVQNGKPKQDSGQVQSGESKPGSGQGQNEKKQSDPGPGKADQAAPAGRNDISAGLQSYKKGDYQTAFRIFSELSEKRDANAQLLLARMYEKGEGTSRNEDRARFWYKSSADIGNPDAQYAYGTLILANTSSTDNEEEVKTGMMYLERAADQGHAEAMDRHIELALRGIKDSQRIYRAMGYCDIRTAQMKDSYDKNIYQDKKKALQEKRKNEARQEKAQKVPTNISIIGNILYIVGFLYLFRGIHPELWEGIKFLGFLPSVKPGMIIPWDTFTAWAGSFLPVEGIFGIEVLAVGAALSSIGATIYRKKSAKRFGKFTRYVFFAIFAWHVWASVTLDEPMPEEEIFMAVIVPMILGIIVGKIVKRIFKMNEEKDDDE